MPKKKRKTLTIRPYEKNAKKHPDKQLLQIAKSIKEFGWRQPIVVDKNDTIIVGHGRWFAYQKFGKELGLKEPWIEKAEDLTDEQVKAYRLADNKLNESEWDMDLVIPELRGLSDEMVDLTGFDKSDILLGELDDLRLLNTEVLVVFPPEAPRLKERAVFQCKSKEEYDLLVKFFGGSEESKKLSVEKLKEVAGV